MSGGPEVVVVSTGVANLASVLAGLRRVGASPRLAETPAEVLEGERVVVPGVGTFGAALETLRAAGLAEPLRHRVANQRPTLAVCAGFQLLCQTSGESPDVEGLGLIPGRLERFEGDLPCPQMGWNLIQAPGEGGLLESGYVYFANSYRLAESPPGWRVALAEHGGPFVAAVERGPVLGCQFHPELSGALGQALLRRWLGAAA